MNESLPCTRGRLSDTIPTRMGPAAPVKGGGGLVGWGGRGQTARDHRPSKAGKLARSMGQLIGSQFALSLQAAHCLTCRGSLYTFDGSRSVQPPSSGPMALVLVPPGWIVAGSRLAQVDVTSARACGPPIAGHFATIAGTGLAAICPKPRNFTHPRLNFHSLLWLFLPFAEP